jgi:hypothetical protein
MANKFVQLGLGKFLIFVFICLFYRVLQERVAILIKQAETY